MVSAKKGQISEEIFLWSDGEVPNFIDEDLGCEKVEANSRTTNIHRPSLRFYPADKKNNSGAAVLICPGGGYDALAMGHEGGDVALWLNSVGVNAAVLKYRVPKGENYRYSHETPMLDAARAMRIMKCNAGKWGYDAGEVGILGFSAGGHVAATLCVRFDDGDSGSADAVERESSRPGFAILVYPVISMDFDVTHKGSRQNFMTRRPGQELVDYYSNEKHVGEETPVTFLVHADDDTAVRAENSVLYYRALRAAGVSAEMHIFEKGGHGFGLGIEGMANTKWPQLCAEWMAERKKDVRN